MSTPAAARMTTAAASLTPSLWLMGGPCGVERLWGRGDGVGQGLAGEQEDVGVLADAVVGAGADVVVLHPVLDPVVLAPSVEEGPHGLVEVAELAGDLLLGRGGVVDHVAGLVVDPDELVGGVELGGEAHAAHALVEAPAPCGVGDSHDA